MSKKKILIFASSERSTLELINVVKEIKKRNHDFFFLYSNHIDTQYPAYSINNFVYDTNVENFTSTYVAKTLGNITLPFIPDVLLVSRENWEPEKSIFIEFKQLGTLICCVENSSWLYSEIDSKLELCSRKNFPTNLIDMFFDHSDWTFETKELASWVTHKTKIVGIPKYDNLIEVEPYNKTKPIIIIYGSMNQFMHKNILQKTKNIVKNLKNQYEIFYKPHPVEFIDFKADFTNNFNNLTNIQDVTVIKEEQTFQSIVKSSDINIGILSSIMYYPLILNKQVVLFDLKDSGLEDTYNIEKFQGKPYEFWAPIVKVNSFNEFKQLIGEDFINKTIERKNNLMKDIYNNLALYDDECMFTQHQPNLEEINKKVLAYFNSFNDFKASERIVNEIENLYV
jgi:hypothetical protein